MAPARLTARLAPVRLTTLWLTGIGTAAPVATADMEGEKDHMRLDASTAAEVEGGALVLFGMFG